MTEEENEISLADQAYLDQCSIGGLIVKFLEKTLTTEGPAPSIEILKAKLALFEQHWEKFSKNHLIVNRYYEELKDKKYYSENYYDRVEAAYFDTKIAIQAELDARAPNK